MGYRFLGTCNPKGQADTLFFINDVEADKYKNCTFAAFSLNSTDKLRLMDHTPAQIEAVGQAITQYWRRGIQSKQTYHPNMYEFKLYGDPWRCSNRDVEALQVRVVYK